MDYIRPTRVNKDIQKLFREFRIDHAIAGEHHHARPGWIAIRKCPFCSSVNYHLGFNVEGGYFNCWKCRGHGIISTLVRLGIPYDAASAFYRGRDPTASREEREARGRLVEPPGRSSMSKAHREYLRGRGFDPEKLEETWELEGIGQSGGNLAWRIYVPITYRGERVSWTSRAIGREARPRYLSASAREESISHRRIVYGIDYCQHGIIAVEGPADAWRVGPGAGALFGIDYSSSQVLLLASFPYRVICFDSSPDAQRTASRLSEELATFPGVTVNVQLDSEDPGCAKHKEIRHLRKLAKLPENT